MTGLSDADSEPHVATMHIAEFFRSIQGEGRLTGTPSAFVRTSTCNLRCQWCDTPYASWEPRGESMSVDALMTQIKAWEGIKHVVLTGGEPLISPHVDRFATTVMEAGYHLTIETAGTVWKPLPVSLWSISPKLANSTPDGAWKARHEKRRWQPETVMSMMESGDYQLKFVVSSPADLDEVSAMVEAINAPSEHVMIMPQGRSVPELDAVATWLIPELETRGWSWCDRLQIRLFGDTPGT